MISLEKAIRGLFGGNSTTIVVSNIEEANDVYERMRGIIPGIYYSYEILPHVSYSFTWPGKWGYKDPENYFDFTLINSRKTGAGSTMFSCSLISIVLDTEPGLTPGDFGDIVFLKDLEF